MKKNANVVGDYTRDQFYQVKRVCTERDADCTNVCKSLIDSISDDTLLQSRPLGNQASPLELNK